MKLRVCERGPIKETIKGSMKKLKPGTVFEADDKRAAQLLNISPAIVEKAGDAPVGAPATEEKTEKKGKK